MSWDPKAPGSKITKRFFSWEQIHETVLASVATLKEKVDPTVLVGISGGGLVPARMLRSGFKLKYSKTLPIQVVGAVHYDDDERQVLDTIKISQWLSPDMDLNGARLLLVDEVDDSRKTLSLLVAEMLKHFDQARAAHEAAGKGPWVQPILATYVIHNKIRPKEADIDARVYPAHYFAGEHTPNMWHVYPWDAEDITAHTAMAHAQAWYFREKPGELALALEASNNMSPATAASVHVHYADGGSTAAPKLDTTLQQLPQQAAASTPMPIHEGSRVKSKSALTSALAHAGSGTVEADSVHQNGEQLAISPQSPSLPRVGSGVWRPEADGLYFNMGYVPAGLEPRFGSLTLVEYGSHMANHSQHAQPNGC